MKQYSSRTLRILSGIYIGFPAVYLTTVAVLFNISLENCVQILLSSYFWGLSLLAIFTGIGLWERRRWAWYSFLATNTLLLYESFSLWISYGQAVHGALGFLICVALCVGCTYAVAHEVRVPYFFPRIRWWESNPRYRLAAPVLLRRKDGSVIEAEVLDIAVSGCFVKLRQDLLQDEHLNLNFSLFDLPVACTGTVVWRAASTVTHPKGVGIRFEAITKMERRSLRLIGRRLKQIADLYKKSRHLLSPEEFQRELDRLEHVTLKDREDDERHAE